MYASLIFTLPETNSLPLKNRGPPGKGDSELGNHPFLGANMFVFFREAIHLFLAISNLTAFFWGDFRTFSLPKSAPLRRLWKAQLGWFCLMVAGWRLW